EIVWFLQETDALRKVQAGTAPDMRARLLAETRHWVLRDLRGSNEAGRRRGNGWHGPAWLNGLLARFSKGTIEELAGGTWAAFTLEALWAVCREKAAQVSPPPPPPAPIRHRDLLLRATGMDTDVWVHEVLVRLCGAFLDQGVAEWSMPGRENGLFRAFLTLYRQVGIASRFWLHDASEAFARLDRGKVAPVECVRESLRELGAPEREQRPFLSATLLALGGWAGIMCQIEERGDRVPLPAPKGTLVEFVAVRLLLERFALKAKAAQALD